MFKHQALLNVKRSSELNNVAAMRKILAKTLLMLKIDNSLKNKMLLAFTEAANNVVEHGKPAATYIQLQLFRLPEYWQISINDDSGFFDNKKQTKDMTHIEANAEGGRGLALIQSLCYEQKYDKKLNHNQLNLFWLKQNFSKPCVLIVEDEIIQRKLILAFLGDEYTILEANNGQEALKIIQQQKIDLVIADIQMPVMNGVSLLEHLNEDEEQSLVPFIFLTGSEDQDILDRINYLGIDSLLHKPISKLQLQRCVKQVQARHQQLTMKLNAQVDKNLAALLKPNVPSTINQYQLVHKQFNAKGGGGDFLLCQLLPNNQGAIIVIGDLMGHDSTSKFFAHTYVSYIRGLLISSLEGLSNHNQYDISELMTRINRFSIIDNLASQTLMTCQIIKLSADTSADNIEIVSAGHPAPFIVNAQNSLVQINSQGMALGIVDDVTYPKETINLQEGERLILYTDGLFESVNDIKNIPTLVTNVQKAMIKSYKKPLTTAIDQIIQSFSSIAGLPVKDDTLLLIIGR